MTGRVSAYTVEKLAPGSYDVLLNGMVIASLVRGVVNGGTADEWEIELLEELPPLRWPAPFTTRSHIFSSYLSALKWLGIGDNLAAQSVTSAGNPAGKVSRYRSRLSASDRYRLRLLADHSRFYATTVGLNSMTQRNFIAPTGRMDDEGRVEWAITDAGRAALAEIMS